MERRGFSVIVGTSLLILVSVVAVGLLYYSSKNLVSDVNSRSNFDCTTINVEPVNCLYVNQGYNIPGIGISQQSGFFALIKRGQGEGDLRSVRILLSNGVNSYYVNPNNYTDSSTDFHDNFVGLKPGTTKEIAYVGDFNLIPTEFTIAPVVGDNSECNPFPKKVKCQQWI